MSVTLIATGPLASSGGANPNISLTCSVIANGFAGQAMASAAFNALSPITSTGDLIEELAQIPLDAWL